MTGSTTMPSIEGGEEKARIEQGKALISGLFSVKRNAQLFAAKTGNIQFRDDEPIVKKESTFQCLEMVMIDGEMFLSIGTYTNPELVWGSQTEKGVHRTFVQIIDDFNRGVSKEEDFILLSKALERLPAFWEKYLAYVKSEQEKIEVGLERAREVMSEM